VASRLEASHNEVVIVGLLSKYIIFSTLFAVPDINHKLTVGEIAGHAAR
jgi:hypothetical protein